MTQDDSDELLRLLIFAVRAEKPIDAEELAERIAAMVGVPPVTAGARALSGAGSR